MANLKSASKPAAKAVKNDKASRIELVEPYVVCNVGQSAARTILEIVNARQNNPKTPLAEFKELLAEYPMDDQQRASVFANAQTLPEPQVVTMIQRMRTTLDKLAIGLSELKKQMPFEEGVEFIQQTTAVAAYEASLSGMPDTECA